ncbi:MAG TPA: MarR family transcriptional regulator [Acidimicrobiia bacterium]|nr:MarR family transcriptional regulator [Acidimicrobiia bacterium]
MTASTVPPARDAEQGEMTTRLRMVVARLSRRLRQEANEGATPSQLAALATIERHGPIALGDLAAHERVRPPSMTRIVAGLEETKLVRRTVDPSDRRVARVSITSEGSRLLVRSRTRRDAFLASLLDHLDADELTLVERAVPILERLADTPN